MWWCGRPGRGLGFLPLQRRWPADSSLFPRVHLHPWPCPHTPSAVEDGPERSLFLERSDIHEERHRLVFCLTFEGRGPPKQLLINIRVMLRKGGRPPVQWGSGLPTCPSRSRPGVGEHPGERGLGLTSSCHQVVGGAALFLVRSGGRWGCRFPRDGPGVRTGRGAQALPAGAAAHGRQLWFCPKVQPLLHGKPQSAGGCFLRGAPWVLPAPTPVLAGTAAR